MLDHPRDGTELARRIDLRLDAAVRILPDGRGKAIHPFVPRVVERCGRELHHESLVLLRHGSRADEAQRKNDSSDIPTVAEFLPGYEPSGWLGVGVPKNTPTPIADTLNREINAGLADSKLKTRLAELGNVPLPLSTADFGQFIAAETEKWRKVIRAANIKAE